MVSWCSRLSHLSYTQVVPGSSPGGINAAQRLSPNVGHHLGVTSLNFLAPCMTVCRNLKADTVQYIEVEETVLTSENSAVHQPAPSQQHTQLPVGVTVHVIRYGRGIRRSIRRRLQGKAPGGA